jgi:hypothetical protein
MIEGTLSSTDPGAPCSLPLPAILGTFPVAVLQRIDVAATDILPS